MLSKNLENSTSYDIFFYKLWKKARVYYTLSISRGGGGPRPPGPPPWIRHCTYIYTHVTLTSFSMIPANMIITHKNRKLLTSIRLLPVSQSQADSSPCDRSHRVGLYTE